MNRFIAHIELKDFLGKINLSIPLSNERPLHLIITGKNSSGKTALIRRLADGLLLGSDLKHHLDHIERAEERKSIDPIDFEYAKEGYSKYVEHSDGVMFSYNRPVDIYKQTKSFFLFFNSKRISKIENPTSIQKTDITEDFGMHERAESIFLKYLVNMAADRSFAREANELEIVEKIDHWFSNLEECIGGILGFKNLKLNFDRTIYNFRITADGVEPFFFDKLSDGYSAIISIIVEIILRAESQLKRGEEQNGIVIIDELETHLHIELQRQILPFLVNFFPNIQFIVTTHSPFVMTSVSNAIVCDLEKKIVTSDLSMYSYQAIIESYFELDQYSNLLKSSVEEYEKLVFQDDLSDAETERRDYLKDYLYNAPKYLSSELASKLQEIKIKELTTHKK